MQQSDESQELTKEAPLDAFNHHEALHTVHVQAEVWDAHVLQHRFVQSDPTLAAVAESISESMHALYQRLGAMDYPG